jgi:hypothetical protein
MIALRKRLEELEYNAQAEYWHHYQEAQKLFGWPVPPDSDINEAVRRIKDILRRIESLPAGSDERANDIANELREWIQSEHERYRAKQ